MQIKRPNWFQNSPEHHMWLMWPRSHDVSKLWRSYARRVTCFILGEVIEYKAGWDSHAKKTPQWGQGAGWTTGYWRIGGLTNCGHCLGRFSALINGVKHIKSCLATRPPTHNISLTYLLRVTVLPSQSMTWCCLPVPTQTPQFLLTAWILSFSLLYTILEESICGHEHKHMRKQYDIVLQWTVSLFHAKRWRQWNCVKLYPLLSRLHSCIMHSIRVGFLKVVLEESVCGHMGADLWMIMSGPARTSGWWTLGPCPVEWVRTTRGGTHIILLHRNMSVRNHMIFTGGFRVACDLMS